LRNPVEIFASSAVLTDRASRPGAFRFGIRGLFRALGGAMPKLIRRWSVAVVLLVFLFGFTDSGWAQSSTPQSSRMSSESASGAFMGIPPSESPAPSLEPYPSGKLPQFILFERRKCFSWSCRFPHFRSRLVSAEELARSRSGGMVAAQPPARCYLANSLDCFEKRMTQPCVP